MVYAHCGSRRMFKFRVYLRDGSSQKFIILQTRLYLNN